MKKVKLSTTLLLIALSVITTINGCFIVSHKMYNDDQGNYQQMQKKVSKLYEVMSVVDTYYVGELDTQSALDGAAKGYVDNMGDKWSYYLSAEEYKEYKEDNNESLVGIGISVVYNVENDALLVTDVYDGSPAQKAGLMKLDLITAVDGASLKDVGYTATVNAVRGEENTPVVLSVLRLEETLDISVVRKEFDKVSVTFEMLPDNIGYIKISEFDTNTGKQFEQALDTLKTVDGFIFDLRNNGGGLLSELVSTLDLVLPKGTIISTVSKYGEETVYESDEDCISQPMVVLVNENSYSAGEFFPAAISEYGVGTIVGTKTTGKGYSQSPLELSDGSAIVLSTNKYYTPNGKNLANIGLTPDVIVNLTDEEMKNYYYMTFDNDPQFISALEQIKFKISE